MKKTIAKTALVLVLAFLCGALTGLAADAAAQPKAKEKLKPYPLKTCLVTGEKLGDMGEAYVYEYKGREIKFCCKGCVKDFEKDPAKYIKKLEAAEAKEKAKDKDKTKKPAPGT